MQKKLLSGQTNSDSVWDYLFNISKIIYRNCYYYLVYLFNTLKRGIIYKKNKMAENVAGTDKKWTDEERLKLSEKLDAELDEFINGLEKKRYTEGWPEDRWQEEMEKHPFFMKKAPEPGDEVHPLFEGLQKLKYDPEENTKEDLAGNYKEDGNFYMQHKKYRMAVFSYTEAINVECDKPELQAVLFNNRSAANFYLENYRSSLSDAQKALELNPDYDKARWRAAQCAFHLNRFDLCTEICDTILEKDASNTEVMSLRNKVKNKKAEKERDYRRETAGHKSEYLTFIRLCKALKLREVKFDDKQKDAPITQSLLIPKILPLEDHAVHLDETDNTLVWPAAYVYPEYSITDFQQQLQEIAFMEDCISLICAEPMECDKEHIYRPGNVTVYYENRLAGTVHKVDLNKSIRDIISEENFYVTGGCLLFYIVPTGSSVEEDYLDIKNRIMIVQ